MQEEKPEYIGWYCVSCSLLLLKNTGDFLVHIDAHDDWPVMQPAFAGPQTRYLKDD